jgi:(1->4)-alpha-D-glucan 1-alpha-D-glucosylmutase
VIRTCTYRVQLHAGFTFDDAAAQVDYLASLGANHLYCSPILQAASGSTHGYDVVDHSRLNDELGGDAGYRRLLDASARAHLHQVLDIVPNHMALSGRANRWWWDVLENGQSSRYAGYFDINWDPPEQKMTALVLMPVLGDHYGRVLEAGELVVQREGGAFVVRYHEHEAPLSPRSVDDLVAGAAKQVDSDELASLATSLGHLPHALLRDADAVAERHRDKEVLRDRLAALCEAQPELARAVDAEINALNGDTDALDGLLRRQNYRLAFWRTASEELDYRRFFNIETLVGLRIEDERVFADTHRLILDLVAEGAVDGLRVDHVDGLRDPEAYLRRLAEASGGTYVVVEKILEQGEALPPAWPVAGTSGYEFLNRVDNLFVATTNESEMTACYQRFAGEGPDAEETAYDDVVHAAKVQIMRQELAAEVERITDLLTEVCEDQRRHRDHTRRELRDALRELTAAFPVYRTYVQPGRIVTDADRAHVDVAIQAAARQRPDLDGELLHFLGELLVLGHPGRAATELAVRFQQLSSPVMAKGVEDTAFYRYHRLISLNEVGGDPGTFGRPVEQFHTETAEVAARWPETMLCLSTHDTKRSADVRARIHLLSEIPEQWETAVSRWSEVNERHRRDGWPDRNAEYLLYQTLVGAWPLDAQRTAAFMEKAAKEAKVHTSWTDPVPDYDEALQSFVGAVLADAAFVADLEGFLAEQRLVERGRLTSLAQTTLLLTCPGVPDLYQGSELWDHSLVDPDNRRPVDYDVRRRLLDELGTATPEQARARTDEGGPKLWLIHRLLDDRRRHPEAYGPLASYEPLGLNGPRRDHAVAFARGGERAVVVPRLVAGLAGDWAETTVVLPKGRWTSMLDGSTVVGGEVPVAELLARFPVAVLGREGS